MQRPQRGQVIQGVVVVFDYFVVRLEIQSTHSSDGKAPKPLETTVDIQIVPRHRLSSATLYQPNLSLDTRECF